VVKIGVIGCGRIAEKHLNAYKKLKDVEITVTDIVEKGKAIAQNYSVHWHDKPDDLILGDRVDAIDVCIPTSLHAEVIFKALESGKHVFCEKPLARNLEETLKIHEKALKADKILMVGYLYRFHPAFQFAGDIIGEHIIGEPYYAIFRIGGRGSHTAWKHKREIGGGAGNEMLVHMLDIIVWHFGSPKNIENLYTDTLLQKREIEDRAVDADAEDLIWLKMEMANGAKIFCESDLITPSYMNYIEVHGTNGSLWTSILDYFPTIVYCKEPRGIYDRGHNFFEFPKVDLFEKELDHFIDCIKNDNKPKTNSIDESVKIMRLLESIK
jgi:predicted dehydrogenase